MISFLPINSFFHKRLLRLVILFILPLSLSGCFEVLEDVFIYNDGSGKFRYIVNFSQSKSKIDLLIEQGEVEGYKIPPKDEMQDIFESQLEEATKIDGIINPSGTCDLDNYIVEFTCKFNSFKELNKAIDNVKAKSDQIEADGFKYYSFDKGNRIFQRSGDDLLKDQYENMSKAQRLIFSGAYYTSIYRFETEIDTILEGKSKISKTRKASFKKIPVINITSDGKVLNQEIKLK